MPTLYVENIPAEIYEALKTRARAQGRSLSAEVIKLLTENVPTEAELAKRRAVIRRVLGIGRRNRGKVVPARRAARY